MVLEPSGEFEASDIFANKVTRKYLDVGLMVRATGIGCWLLISTIYIVISNATSGRKILQKI